MSIELIPENSCHIYKSNLKISNFRSRFRNKSSFILGIYLFLFLPMYLSAATGVYFGSFDPPTTADVSTIDAAIHDRSLERLIVMVARHSSDPNGYTCSAKERIEMLKASLKNAPASKLTFVEEPWAGRAAYLAAIRPLLRENFFTLYPNKLKNRNKVPLAAQAVFSPFLKKSERSLRSLKVALHQEAFESYIREIAAHFPESNLSCLAPPRFNPAMSNFGRVEQFIATALKATRVFSKQAVAFGKKSEKLLLSTERDMLYPKLHCLQPFCPNTSCINSGDLRVSVSKLALPTPQSQEGHTLDVEAYCADRFAHALFSTGYIHENNTYFHLGSTQEAIAYHEEEGFTEQFEIFTKAVKKLRINLLVRNPHTNSVRLVICNLYGEDTLQHVALQFNQIAHFREVTLIRHLNPRPFFDVDPQFQNMAFSSEDHLIIGFKNAIGRLLNRNAAWKKRTYSVSGLSIDFYENGHTKQRIILSKCVFGDQLTEVLHHFYSKGVRQFQYFGTAGSLSPNLHVGDAITPSHFYVEGELVPFENAAQSLLAKNGKVKTERAHGWTQSPVLETESFLKRLQAAGVEAIDIEARYYAHFFNGHPDAVAGLTLFISDEPFGMITLDQFNTMDHYIDEAFTSVCDRLLPFVNER